MDRTLLLNTTFEPISVLSWRKAVTMVYLDKVEVLKEYDKRIQGVRVAIRQPAVIRLRSLVRSSRAAVKFSRKNIFLRDDHTCQYCGETFDSKRLTCDHIVPKSRGGLTEWTNIVTCCIRCNLKKSDKLPDEVKMFPRKRPSRPNGFYMFMLHLGVGVAPDHWKDYLFLKD